MILFRSLIPLQLVENKRDKKMKNMSLIFAMLFFTAACAAPTQYQIRTAEKGALTFGYNKTVEVLKDGQKLTDLDDEFEGLDVAVGCVPKAQGFAAPVTKTMRSGNALRNVGVAVTLTTLLGGLAMTIVSIATAEPLESPLFWGGIGTMTAGPLAIGAPLRLSGHKRRAQGFADALDAVYSYNDHFQTDPACGFVPETEKPSPMVPASAFTKEQAAPQPPIITTEPFVPTPPSQPVAPAPSDIEIETDYSETKLFEPTETDLSQAE